MRKNETLVFTVTDLKQFAYCPRIPYYSYCLPLIRPTTFKMKRGIAAHEEAQGKARRRTLKAYGLTRGERHFDVHLASEALGLRGRVDLVVETDETPTGAKELIPVEYKNTRRSAGQHWKRQLAAYGLMLEETWELPVRRGFFYYLPSRRAQEVSITAGLRADVQTTLETMRDVIRREAMPGAPRRRRRCVDCEFRRFCNDVL
jgi:CRISPR-associated exonuclease Cas4